MSSRWLIRWRKLPSVGMWLLALVSASALYLRQEHGLVLTGFAEETRIAVAAAAAGCLREVIAVPDQPVATGEILATLDDTGLKLEIAAARSELRRLRHEAERETAAWALQLEGDRRRFAGDVETTWLEYLEARATLASAQVALQGMEATLARTRALWNASLTSAATLEADSVACQAQREVVRGHGDLVAALSAKHKEAESRMRRFAQSVGEPAETALPATLAAAIEVQEVRLQLAELAVARCALRAPAAGVVSEILRRAGEVVAAGDAVAVLVSPHPASVVAYAPEERLADISTGMRVRVRRLKGGPAAASEVISVAPAVSIVPERTLPGAPVPTWGLAVRVRMPAGMAARPGEAFRIRF